MQFELEEEGKIMGKPPEPRPGWKEPEYPDEAGYPDGMGTLDEGTATQQRGDDTAEPIEPVEDPKP